MIIAMKTFLTALLVVTATLRAEDSPLPVAFCVTQEFPKYATVGIEFRDPSGAKWPNFFYGRPADTAGHISLAPAAPSAAFTLRSERMVQEKGEQNRKVLGELAAPVVTLSVASVSALHPVVSKDKNKPTMSAELSGTVEVGGLRTAFKAAATLRHHDGKGDEKNTALMLEARATLKASDLGIKALPTNAHIEMRFDLTAYPPQSAGAVKK